MRNSIQLTGVLLIGIVVGMVVMSSIGMVSFATSHEKRKRNFQPSQDIIGSLIDIRTELAALRKARQLSAWPVPAVELTNRNIRSEPTHPPPPKRMVESSSSMAAISSSGATSGLDGEGIEALVPVNSPTFARPESAAEILGIKAKSKYELLPLRLQRKLRGDCKRKDPSTFAARASSFSPYRTLTEKDQTALGKKLPFFSDYGQDKWIYTNVYGGTPSGVPQDGVFIDVGAREPEVISNSNFWDFYFCWTGLAIEANDKVYPLQRKFRPWSSVNVAIDETARDVTYLRIEGKGHGLSGIYENMSSQHRQRIKTDVKPAQVQRFPLTTTTLATLIRDAGITHVDLLLIDVEGSEYASLASIDWGAVTIDVINFEDNCGRRCIELLTEKGYRMVAKFRQERIFLRKSFMPSLSALNTF
jgi:hypothetical protein